MLKIFPKYLNFENIWKKFIRAVARMTHEMKFGLV